MALALYSTRPTQSEDVRFASKLLELATETESALTAVSAVERKILLEQQYQAEFAADLQSAHEFHAQTVSRVSTLEMQVTTIDHELHFQASAFQTDNVTTERLRARILCKQEVLAATQHSVDAADDAVNVAERHVQLVSKNLAQWKEELNESQKALLVARESYKQHLNKVAHDESARLTATANIMSLPSPVTPTRELSPQNSNTMPTIVVDTKTSTMSLPSSTGFSLPPSSQPPSSSSPSHASNLSTTPRLTANGNSTSAQLEPLCAALGRMDTSGSSDPRTRSRNPSPLVFASTQPRSNLSVPNHSSSSAARASSPTPTPRRYSNASSVIATPRPSPQGQQPSLLPTQPPPLPPMPYSEEVNLKIAKTLQVLRTMWPLDSTNADRYYQLLSQQNSVSHHMPDYRVYLAGLPPKQCLALAAALNPPPLFTSHLANVPISQVSTIIRFAIITVATRIARMLRTTEAVREAALSIIEAITATQGVEASFWQTYRNLALGLCVSMFRLGPFIDRIELQQLKDAAGHWPVMAALGCPSLDLVRSVKPETSHEFGAGRIPLAAWPMPHACAVCGNCDPNGRRAAEQEFMPRVCYASFQPDGTACAACVILHQEGRCPAVKPTEQQRVQGVQADSRRASDYGASNHRGGVKRPNEGLPDDAVRSAEKRQRHGDGST